MAIQLYGLTSSSALKTINSSFFAVLGSQHREGHLGMTKVLGVRGERLDHQEPM